MMTGGCDAVAAFDTSELRRKFDQKSAEADEAAKQIDKERADLALASVPNGSRS